MPQVLEVTAHEVSTAGHTTFYLACGPEDGPLVVVVHGWPEDTSDPGEAFTGYVDMTGMPSRDEILARYAEVSGRQVDDIDYYVVLAKWKLAVVLEQGFQRAGDDEKLLAFGPVVLELMRGAADLAETTDYSVTA